MPSLPLKSHRARAAWRVAAGSAAAILLMMPLPAVAAGAATLSYTGPTVYVVNNGSGTVDVIDAASNALAATVKVGSGPTGIAVAPGGQEVYVTNTDSDSVTFISGLSDKVISTVGLGAGAAPTGIAVAPNGKLLYVADSGADRVSVIQTSTGAVSGTITVGADPGAVAANPNGGAVYVTNTLSHSLSVISTATNSVSATITGIGYFPSAVTVNPTGTKAYVVSECGTDPNCASKGKLYAINTATKAVSSPLTVGYAPTGVSETPDGGTLYVVDGCGSANCTGPGNVEIIDASTMSVYSDRTVGYTQPGLVEGTATSPDNTLMFSVNNCGTDSSCGSAGTISEFDTNNISSGPAITLTVGADPVAVAVLGWSGQQMVAPGTISTSTTPAVASIAPFVFAATTVGGVVELSSFDVDTGTWSAEQAVPGASTSLAPALAGNGSTLWVAWTTSGGGVEYNQYDTSADDWNFGSGQAGPPADTATAPALATVGGAVYVAWTDIGTHEVGYSDYTTSWSEPELAPSSFTLDAPALASFPGQPTLWLAYKARSSSAVFYQSGEEGSFTGQHTVPQALTDSSPSIAVTPLGFFVFWKGNGTNGVFWKAAVFAGWTPQVTIHGPSTDAGPGSASLGAGLFLLWKDTGASNLSYSARI